VVQPVITKVYSLGPAHLGYITSSQSTAGMVGRNMVSLQISVNTVTGVVINGEYKSVADIPTLENFASEAYNNKLPILLEIESWYRDPKSYYAPLEYSTTAFYKIPHQARIRSNRRTRCRPICRARCPGNPGKTPFLSLF